LCCSSFCGILSNPFDILLLILSTSLQIFSDDYNFVRLRWLLRSQRSLYFRWERLWWFLYCRRLWSKAGREGRLDKCPLFSPNPLILCNTKRVKERHNVKDHQSNFAPFQS
jgi:hypothetical protein